VNNFPNTGASKAGKIVYWHHELPPVDAELVAEHTIEATSGRVPGTLSHRDDLWDRCYRELMVNTQARLAQEIGRLGGHYAHVHKESIDTHHDDVAGEAWLHGRFSYVLYRRPSQVREPHRGSGTDKRPAA
jgi:hypothetical protein